MLDTLADLLARLPPNTPQIAGTWVAALLTLATLSYVFGGNPAFRLAEYLLVGIAAGYATALAWNHMLWPRLQLLVGEPATYWYYGVFFVLGLLLLCRGSRSMSVLGNLPLGVLFGIGAALALGGGLTGTFIPQIRASVLSVNPADYGEGSWAWAYVIDPIILVAGTIAALTAFHFGARTDGRLRALWRRLVRAVGGVGRGLITICFGALFASAALSFFAILNSRLVFLLRDWLKLLYTGRP